MCQARDVACLVYLKPWLLYPTLCKTGCGNACLVSPVLGRWRQEDQELRSPLAT